MHSLAALVGQVFDANKLYATIASAPVEAGSADASWLVMPDADSGSLRQHVVAAHKIAPAQIELFMDCTELVEDLSRDGKLLLVREASEDPRIPDATRIDLSGEPGDPEAPRPEDLVAELLEHDRVVVW